jgi:hypothetical protein
VPITQYEYSYVVGLQTIPFCLQCCMVSFRPSSSTHLEERPSSLLAFSVFYALTHVMASTMFGYHMKSHYPCGFWQDKLDTAIHLPSDEVGLAEGGTVAEDRAESFDHFLACTNWATLDPEQARIPVAIEFR